MKNIIFVAPPAAGKGTISSLLVDKFNYYHVSTGDELRNRVLNGDTEIKNLIESGKLVSDEIITSVIEDKINDLKGRPFILDGCPRTLNQAEILDEKLNADGILNNVVFKFNIDLDVAKNRILGRVVCKCGKSYNIYNEAYKPKQDGICDSCGSILEHRKDDDPIKVENRFLEYEKNVESITKFYKEKNLLIEFDVNNGVEEIFSNIEDYIND